MARVYETRLPDPEGERFALWEKEWGDDFYVLRSQAVGWPSHEPVNRQGLPDRTHAEEKPEGVFRLTILGDSTTAGTPFRVFHSARGRNAPSMPRVVMITYSQRSGSTGVAAAD